MLTAIGEGDELGILAFSAFFPISSLTCVARSRGDLVCGTGWAAIAGPETIDHAATSAIIRIRLHRLIGEWCKIGSFAVKR
jgi:hypothetical protein